MEVEYNRRIKNVSFFRVSSEFKKCKRSVGCGWQEKPIHICDEQLSCVSNQPVCAEIENESARSGLQNSRVLLAQCIYQGIYCYYGALQMGSCIYCGCMDRVSTFCLKIALLLGNNHSIRCWHMLKYNKFCTLLL